MTTAARKRQHRTEMALEDAAMTVTDNWRATIPITMREIDTVEIYLGRVVDELLRAHGVHHVVRSSGDPSAVVHHDSTATKL